MTGAKLLQMLSDLTFTELQMEVRVFDSEEIVFDIEVYPSGSDRHGTFIALQTQDDEMNEEDKNECTI